MAKREYNMNFKEKTCPQCGISKPSSGFYKNRPFQCKDCNNKYRAEYIKRDPEKVKRQYLNCAEKKNYGGLRKHILKDSCEWCGSKENLCVHHKDGNGRDSGHPNNNSSNFETLCNPCHARLHALKRTNSKRLSIATELLKEWIDMPLNFVGDCGGHDLVVKTDEFLSTIDKGQMTKE